jgi:hypothetical protein
MSGSNGSASPASLAGSHVKNREMVMRWDYLLIVASGFAFVQLLARLLGL